MADYHNFLCWELEKDLLRSETNMSRKKLPLRICHPNGILKLGIVSDRKVQDLKALIREKLKIKTEKDYVSSEKGVISDLQWLETCKKEEELCGDAFPKRGMKEYYRYVEKIHTF